MWHKAHQGRTKHSPTWWASVSLPSVPKPTPTRKHVVVELTLDQYALVRARCAREGLPMSVALPSVLHQWAAQTETLEVARSATYPIGGTFVRPRKPR